LYRKEKVKPNRYLKTEIYMNKELTPEQRKQRTELVVKVAGLLGVCLVLAPLSTMITAGLGALAALAVGAAGVFTVWKFLPWFALKVGNWRLKALKAESMKNPVETLQTEYAKKMDALSAFKDNIRIFAGQILTFGDQVKQYVKDGLEDAQVYVEQLGKMKKLLELRQLKYQEAQQALKDFAETIERTDRKWKMACAAMAMNEAAGQMEGDVFSKICIETALDSVQTKLNQSFADLEIALLDDEKSKNKNLTQKLEFDPNTSVRQKIAIS
jgi:hypothetical protein